LQDRGAGDGRREAAAFRLEAPATARHAAARRVKEAVFSLRALPGVDLIPRDALDREVMGSTPISAGLRQVAARAGVDLPLAAPSSLVPM